MPIKVTFPDGLVRELNSNKRLVPSTENDGKPYIIEEPAYDPKWLFSPIDGGWRAIER